MTTSSSDRRVLITGGAGFIGRSCIPALIRQGYEVHSIGRGDADAPGEAVRRHRCDLLNPEQVVATLSEVRPTHLLHCAWDVGHEAYWAAPQNFDWLAAGVHLLRSFAAYGGYRAVGVGTCAEYSWTEAVYHEQCSPTTPATPYGACKLALGSAFAGGRALGLSTAWARIFFPYGPFERPGRLLPTVIKHLLRGQEVNCTLGTQVRDFIYVDDVGSALVAMLSADIGGAVNVGLGEGVPLRTIIEAVVAEIGADPKLVRYGGLPTRLGDPEVLVADTRRLTCDVGFQPTISLREGIRRAIAFWSSKVF